MMTPVPDLPLGAKTHHRRLLLIVFGATLATDVFSKIAISQLIPDSSLAIVGDVQLRILYNSQAPFGLGNSALGSSTLAVAALAMIGILTWAWLARSRAWFPVGIMTGGAAGNLLDRLSGGSVLDWIDPGFAGVFNIADLAIVTGLVLFVFASFAESPPEEHAGTPNEDPACG
ncbi:MAG: signal peptidase II [Chloroflexi bacterium]|nr:signal peptidase II [Chloroflexota bacterium]